MNLTDLIYTQSLVLAGKLDTSQELMLRMLCRSAQRGLEQRLRQGITPEDCQSDFVSAASLMALAALSETDEMGMAASISVGDFVVKKSDGNSAADCLRRQAMLLMAPYLRDAFSFAGV